MTFKLIFKKKKMKLVEIACVSGSKSILKIKPKCECVEHKDVNKG